LFASFIVLHGLVHLWYFSLSQKLVEFKPEMGWSGRSWLFTSILGEATTRLLASGLFILATFTFVASGAGLFFHAEWWRSALLGSAVLSAVTTILFWDGETHLIVQKGLLGLLFDAAILVGLIVFKWPPSAF
jgi:hypothetical protein